MKKELKITIGSIGILLLASAIFVCSNTQKKEQTGLLTINVEALAQTEGQVSATCGGRIPYRCYTTCASCKKEWETHMSPGPAANIEGRCTCGSITFN